MLKAVKQFFSEHLQVDSSADPGASEHSINVAAAALLIEVGRADFDVSDEEESHIVDLLRSELQLSDAEVEEIVELAKRESRDATSLHGFTRLVHDNYTVEQKSRLMEQLWTVALADGRIDKYEDYALRKISDLLYLSHQDFVRAKLRAMGET